MARNDKPGPLQRQILEQLARWGSQTPYALSKELGVSEGSITGALSGMRKMNDRQWVKWAKGPDWGWEITPAGRNAIAPCELMDPLKQAAYKRYIYLKGWYDSGQLFSNLHREFDRLRELFEPDYKAQRQATKLEKYAFRYGHTPQLCPAFLALSPTCARVYQEMQDMPAYTPTPPNEPLRAIRPGSTVLIEARVLRTNNSAARRGFEIEIPTSEGNFLRVVSPDQIKQVTKQPLERGDKVRVTLDDRGTYVTGTYVGRVEGTPLAVINTYDQASDSLTDQVFPFDKVYMEDANDPTGKQNR